MPKDILVVDDEADIRTLLQDILNDEDYETRVACNSTEALQQIRARLPHLIVLDIWLQNSALDGLELLSEIKREHPMLPIIMISGHGTIETAVSALKKGAYDFIEKPFKTDRLLHVVQRSLEMSDLQKQNVELRHTLAHDYELIGQSTAMQQLRSTIEKVAPTGSRIMITGPAGCGKEIVARNIHMKSKRADAPFVVVNCALMTPDKLEVELFGTEPGVVQGKPRKIGVFEQAHRGTLLLDEITDMPMETQGKIVRVLQEQRFTRVGGSTPVQVDVRVMASSNKDLSAMIQQGKLREDLFYRLSVVPVVVPSLQSRRDDIGRFVHYFMQRAARAAGTTPRPVSEDVIAAMQSYTWPGNVRQLRNVVEWLLIMAPSSSNGQNMITVDMLPPEIYSNVSLALRSERSQEIMTMPLRDAREMFEREYLLAQVGRFSGNISRTASFVGMERSALHRKLKSLGVYQQEKSHKLAV